MTDARQPICWRPFRLETSFWPIALMTVTRLRQDLKAVGAWGCIRPMPNRVNIPVFSQWLYKKSNAVERFFNKLKHFRAFATRYDKRDDNFLASVHLASIRIWLRSYESVT
ncbi:transposase [Rhizobium sp. SLBN-94]|jgi:transposase|nr:transposase [Rhizobium sp. SLBN-94]